MNNLYTNKRTMNVTSSPVTIQDKDLRDVIFEVPIYQREYSWELEKISDLFDDIESSNVDEGHFLGSLLLFSVDDNTRHIIDGQQRLTTVFLLLYCIRKVLTELQDKDKNNEMAKDGINTIEHIIFQKKKRVSTTSNSTEPRLITGNRDRKLFRAILQDQELKGKIERKKSHKLLFNAIDNFIYPKIKNMLATEKLQGLALFLDKIIACRYIVMTAEKVEDQRLLFKTLNSRGLELSESDLIKNEICNNVPANENIQEAVNIWDEMREILESRNAKIDLFLFHYINSLNDAQIIRLKMDAKVNISKNEKDDSENTTKYPPIPEKSIFSAYELKIKSTLSIIEFLENLKSSASLYVEISNPHPYNSDLSSVYLEGLKAMNITKCYPLLLRGKHVLNTDNFERLAQAIETLSFRHSITKREPKELEKFYYTLLDSLKSDEDINELIEKIKQHPTVKEDKTFEDFFIRSSPKSNVSKMILQRIIKYYQKNSEKEPVSFFEKDIWFEHIMPQTPAGEWLQLYTDKDSYEENLNCLGNLTYILNTKNIKASNKDFSVKKEKFYTSSTIQLNNDLVSYDKWDFNTIKKRQAELYNIAKEIWKI